MANNIQSLDILDPIYQDIIDNTVIQSDCGGSSYRYDWRDATFISGSRYFTLNNDDYSFYVSSNDSGPSEGIVCWREDGYGSRNIIYLHVDETTYSRSANRVNIYLAGRSWHDDFNTVRFSGTLDSYANGTATISISSISATNNYGSYTTNYRATVSVSVSAFNKINASIYGNIEQIASWLDLNATVNIRFR